jgi:hypothetical protein
MNELKLRVQDSRDQDTTIAALTGIIFPERSSYQDIAVPGERSQAPQRRYR